MDLPQLLFVAIGAVGTLAAACLFVGERRWHRRLVDLRVLLMLVAAMWVPATLDLVVRQELLNAQELGDRVSSWWMENFQPPVTTTTSSTTTTVP